MRKVNDMTRKTNIRQTRSRRNGCLIKIALLAVVSVFLKPAFAAGPKAYVGNFKDDTVSVIDLESKRVTVTIPIPPGPHGMVITPDNRWLYVASDGTSTVSVIETATDKLVENINVGRNPHGVAVTRDGKYVLVGVYDADSVAFIDTATRKVIGSVAVGKPHNIAIHPNGRVAYAGSQVPGGFSLAVIDLATRKLTDNIPLEKSPRGLEFDPNGSRLYITQAGVDSVVVMDPANNKTIAEIAAGVSPHYANFTPEGNLGLTAVQGPSLLVVFNPQTNGVEKSIKVGSRPHWVASSPDGRTALTTNEGSNDVSIVDLENGTVTNIPVGNAPRKIAVQTAADRQRSSTRRVTIIGFAFNPSPLEVSPAETVTWVNDDGAPHSVAVNNGSVSDTLLPGSNYSTEFDRPGDYDYVCSIHPYMAGKIIVTERRRASVVR
jgi:YVTN family beta-propeller protein